MFGDATCAWNPEDLGSNLVATQPILLPLASNGAGARTHLPRFDNEALGRFPGDICAGAGYDVDQRGQPRDGDCDVGAVQRQPVEGGIFGDGLESH